MKKILGVSIILFTLLVAGELIFLGIIEKKAMIAKDNAKSEKNAEMTSKDKPKISAWQEMISSSSSQILNNGQILTQKTYSGQLREILYNQTYGGIKSPLTLVFNRDKKLLYFFSESDFAATAFILKGQTQKNISDMKLRNGDIILLTIYLKEQNNIINLEKSILEKK